MSRLLPKVGPIPNDWRRTDSLQTHIHTYIHTYIHTSVSPELKTYIAEKPGTIYYDRRLPMIDVSTTHLVLYTKIKAHVSNLLASLLASPLAYV
jgi:hypothetical protein